MPYIATGNYIPLMKNESQWHERLRKSSQFTPVETLVNTASLWHPLVISWVFTLSPVLSLLSWRREPCILSYAIFCWSSSCVLLKYCVYLIWVSCILTWSDLESCLKSFFVNCLLFLFWNWVLELTG